MSRSWPLGRLILQGALGLLLIATCTGALGRDGLIGAIVILGFVILLWAIVRALGGRRR